MLNMGYTKLMEVVLFLAWEIGVPLLFVALMHYKLSSYPEPLPRSEETRKGILETLILWAVMTALFAWIIFSGLVGSDTEVTVGLLTKIIFITFPVFVVVPALYFRMVKKWSLRDFGLLMPLSGKRPIIIFAVAILALAGALPLMNSDFVPVISNP